MIDFVDLGEVPYEEAASLLVTLSEDLRQSDLDEITATSALPPAEALVASCLVSTLGWVMRRNGVPICAFGCAPTGVPGAGHVWMLGSPKMDQSAVTILRLTRPYLDQMHRIFPFLWNYIDARNDRSMRWLEWAGFRLLEAHPEHGREKRLFFTFARYQPSV